MKDQTCKAKCEMYDTQKEFIEILKNRIKTLEYEVWQLTKRKGNVVRLLPRQGKIINL